LLTSARTARRVKQLVAGYSRRLGGLACDPVVHTDIVKLAEHEAVAEELRGYPLTHERSITPSLISMNALCAGCVLHWL
jgi:hypothetical protein